MAKQNNKRGGNKGAGQNSNGNGKANGEGGENNPPETSPPNAASRRGQRRPAQNQASTGNATRDSRANASELEGLRQQLRQLTEERTTSKEAITSLENANKLLEVKLAEIQSGQAARPVHPKRKKIRRPKGSNWRLIDKMGLTHDEDKYKQIIGKLKNMKKEAGFKDGALFSQQSREKIVKFCRLARKKVPYLCRFKGDWATAAYLRRSFTNRRGYLSRADDEDPMPVDEDGAGPSGTHHDDDSAGNSDDGDLSGEEDKDDFMDDSDDDDN